MKILYTMLLAWIGLAMPLNLQGQTLQYNLSLTEVTFLDYRESDPNFFPVKKDDGSGFYIAVGQPHWRDAQPNLNTPIAYQSGKKPRMTAKLELRCPKPINGRVKILCKMMNTNNSEETITTFESKSVTPTGSAGNYSLLYEKGVGSEFAKKIRYFSGCTLNWEISFEDGSGSRQVVRNSRNTNELYVTWKKPLNEGMSLFAGAYQQVHTLFHLSCKANDGEVQLNNSIIFANLWKLFTPSAVESNLNLTRRAGSKLVYYNTFSSQAQSSLELIQSLDGQCYAFASLLLHLCKIQGMELDYLDAGVEILPNLEPVQQCGGNALTQMDAKFMVKNWQFEMANCNTDCAQFPIVAAYELSYLTLPYLQNPNRYKFVYTEAFDKEGTFGQNNRNPHSYFQAHAIVKFNNKLYDPSYGAVYDSLEDIKKAISSWAYERRNVPETFFRKDLNGNGNLNDSFHAIFIAPDVQVNKFFQQ